MSSAIASEPKPPPGAASASAASPPAAPTAAAPLLYDVGRIVCRLATTLAFDLKVYGLHHVPLHGGVLLLSNHQSYLDPVLVAVRLRRPLSFLAKSELFKNPAFSWLIRNLNAFPVRQGAGDVGAMRETIRRLNEGHALMVFPEGSRTPDGQIQPLEGGFSLVVRKTDVPVIPVAVDGAFQAWGRGRKLPRPGPVSVAFGPPMTMQGLRPNEIVATTERTLRDLFDQLRTQEHQGHQLEARQWPTTRPLPHPSPSPI